MARTLIRMFLNRNFVFGALVVILVGTQAYWNKRLRYLDTAFIELPTEAVGKWNPELFKIFTFGHLGAGIDWLWIKTLQDQAIAHVAPGTHPSVYYDLDLATDLDPLYYQLYISGANLLSVIRSDGPGARDLLEKANKFRKEKLPAYPEEVQEDYWSNAWNVPALLGYVYLYELNDMPHAAEAFKEAADLPKAPGYLHRLRDKFNQPAGLYEVGVKVLDFMLSQQNEPKVKAALQQKRQALFISAVLYKFNMQFKEWLAKQRDYRASEKVTQEKWNQWFTRFRATIGLPLQDPFGGKLGIDEKGKILTSTPHQKVFGLE